MTERQYKLLHFIKSFTDEKGFMPSYQQMCDGIGAKSKSQIHSLINMLEEQGFVKRVKGKTRSVEILRLPKSETTAKRDLINFVSAAALQERIAVLEQLNKSLKTVIEDIINELVEPDDDVSLGLAEYFNQDLIYKIYEVLK